MTNDGRGRAGFRGVGALVCCAALVGCGGEGGGGGATPTPPSTPAPSSLAPCATALVTGEGVSRARTVTSAPEGEAKRDDPLGRTKADLTDALWTHSAARARQTEQGVAAVVPAATEDIGEIAVIEDDGAIILPANAFDLANTGVRFRRSGAGYDVSRIDGRFREALGNRLTLTDDDSVRLDLPAALGFFGGTHAAACVNSDGNVTFERGDGASLSRSVGRFLSGAPRIAGFFADLDPSVGGRVFALADTSGLTVTWCSVRGFESPDTVTMQLTLQPDGTVEMRFGNVALRAAVVGVSPGNTETFAAVDLSASTAGGASAVGERFAAGSEADMVVAAQRFYRSHPDIYDQLVFWGDTALIPQGEAFAQEFLVANDVRGIGLSLGGDPRAFGSAGRLQSIVNMDRMGKYPASPTDKFLGENTLMSLLGQESGHRWLTFVEFLDADRRVSRELLGRQEAHWSFFMDSDASVMEGNDIEALGGGAFRTVGAVQRFSRLDQYVMGLVGPELVPPFFYVESPVNVVPGSDRSSSPRVGVTFAGTRRDVVINDLVSAMGPRMPTAAESPKVWRQAWICLVRRGVTANRADVARIEGWRAAWEAFFLQATEGRMRLDARLR